MSASAYQVAGLLDKLKHADSDLRFMALSDLSNELSKEGAPFDEVTERKFVAAVVKALDDTNGEVQNLAVKILAPLVRKGRDATVLEVVDRLCDLLVHKKDDLRDIGAIGMKTVVAQVPANSSAATNMVKRLVPKLIALLMNPTAVHFDTIDTLSEITVRFGSMLAEHSADPSNQSSFTRQIQDALFPYLSNPRPAIRKRTVAAFGNLVVHESDELFDALMHKTVTEMKEKEGAEDYERLKTFVGLIGTLARFSARRVGKYVDTLLPLLIAYVAFDNDELREACFQTFESFIVRCPTEISAHIPEITKVSLEYLKHDPNYDDGEDNDEDEDEEMEQDADADDEMDEDADEEGDEDEEGYSDDEDMSWKVRRASAKTLSSIINTRTELIESFFDNVAPTLVKRFKEREESVRVEILATFITLIRQVGALHGVSGGAGNVAAKKAVRGIQVTSLLQNLVGKLSKTLSKELNGKSVPTRQSGFILLRELAVVLEGGLQDTFGQFVASIQASLATSTTEAAKKHGKGPKPINNLNLKIEVLDFLKVALPLHHPSVFSPYLQNLVPPIVAAISGKFFKVTSEALVVSVELVKVIRPFSSNHLDDAMVVEEVPSTPASPKAAEYIHSLYKTVFARVNVADLDVEVKERAILALVTLLAQTVDLTGVSAQEVQSTVLPLLIERLRNELTRLTTVKGFKTLCESPFCGSQAGALLDLQSVLETSLVAELCSFLKKANRGLKVASLGTLTSVFTKYGSTVSEQSALLVLQETPAVFADTDMNVFPLAVDLLAVIADARGSSSAVLAAAKDATVAGKIVQVIMEGPHLVGYGTAGLDALVAFWRVLVVKGGVAFFDEMVALLTAAAETKGLAKSSFRPIAQSLAALIVEAKAFSKLSEYVAKVQDASAHENAIYLALNVIGEVGRSIDLSANHPTLQDSLLALFNSPSEEIKHAAAFALGNVALGNLSIYMPLLIQASKEGGKRRYLILVALKEVIARSSTTSNHSKAHVDSPLKPYSKDLWTLLFSSTEQAKEEGTRTVIAECLGKLAVQDPALYLPELESGVSSESSAVRSTVVLAIRYTFTDASGTGAALHASVVAFDEALSQVIVQFLRLLTDADLSVRHIALATLNSAAHNKPYLIIDTLPELLPLLYQETMIREDLIRTVVMGPFKHKVDEGLDARKSAFECMYTLLERCLSKIEIFAFLDRVAAGLSDPAQEIRMLNHTMLQRLVATSPAALASRLDTMVAPLKEALATVPKTNAVKQEIEKVNELVRSSVRAVLVVGRVLLGLSGGGSGAAGVEASVGGGSCPAFDEFYRMVKAPGYALAEVVASVGVEVDAQPLTPFVIGGTGAPLRQFAFSEDLAKLFVWVPERDEICIKLIAESIAEAMQFDGRIIWDSAGSDGQFKRTASNEKLMQKLPAFELTPFREARDMNQQQQLNLGLGGPSGTGGGGGPSAALSARLGLLGGLNGGTNSVSGNPNLGLTSGLNAMSLNSESEFPSLSSGAMNPGSGVNASSGLNNNPSVLQQQRLAAAFSNASIGQTLKLQMNPNQPARMQPMLPPGMVLTNPPANGLGGGGGGGGGGGPLLSLALGNKQSQFVSSLGSQQQQLNNAFPSMNHPSGAIGNLQQQQQAQISQFGQSIGGAIGNGPIGNHLSSISPPTTNLLAQQQQQQQHQLQHQQSQSALTAQSLLPSAQTNDKYGLLGVIDGLRLSSDPDTNMLSLGCELTSLGLNLNSPTPLYTTLTSVYNPSSLDMSNGTAGTNGSNNHFIIPSCYRVNLNSCDISRVDQVTLMSDDALLM
ncbi:hypothetical protein CcCBS67573_g06084, partial [Chytriomyces confervae]